MFSQDINNSIAGWYFSEEDIKYTLSNGHLINPSIDLTNACNLNCPYCYIEEKNSIRKIRRSGELTIEETIEIINDLKSCGARTINIVGSGEPTIDPHLDEIIDTIYNLNMKTVLFTNGIRLANNPELLKFLMLRNVSIVLKYNSLSENIQDLVAGRKGYALKRNAALELLIDSGFNAFEPTRLGLDIIVFKGNYSEIADIHKFCREKNVFPIAGEFIPTGRTESGKFQGHKALFGFSDQEKQEVTRLLQPISNNERSALVESLEKIDEKFNIKRSINPAYVGGGICTQILGLYIDIEGNIWPCVARKKITNNNIESGLLGNCRKGDRPSVIWKNNQYLKTIRKNYNGACPYKIGQFYSSKIKRMKYE